MMMMMMVQIMIVITLTLYPSSRTSNVDEKVDVDDVNGDDDYDASNYVYNLEIVSLLKDQQLTSSLVRLVSAVGQLVAPGGNYDDGGD